VKILVCIKQVPDAEAHLRVSSDGLAVTVPDDAWRMNRPDECAVEEALRIKATFPGSVVEAISAGPARVTDVLRRALAMGADQGIHILHSGGRDPLPGEVAALIAAVARKEPYGLILAGVMAEDTMQAQTGPMLAAYLGVPCATAVMAETILPDERTVRVERELEGGCRALLEMPLPALLTLQSGINRPRYPVLSHVLRSRRQTLTTLRAGDLPTAPPRERCIRIIVPEPAGKTLVLTGTPAAKAHRLAEIFRGKALW
jgi:electron transfer flavoprotein beta subunit